MPIRTTTLLALLTLLLATISAHAATTVQRTDYHFKVTYPDYWSLMPRHELEKINSFGKANFISGARRGANTPYVLVQVLPPVTDASPEAVIRDMSRSVDAPGVTIHSAVYDPALNAVTIHAKIGPFDSRSYAFPGVNNTVAIHCYALPNEAANAKLDFEKIAGSFQFDPGYQGTFGTGNGPFLNSSSTLITVIAAALIALVLLAAGGILLSYFLRRRNA